MSSIIIRSLAIGIVCFSGQALAGNASLSQPAGGDYQAVSSLVALPDFLPGLGALYVDPTTLPAGPFAAYNRSGDLVSTVYMIPMEDMQAQESFTGLDVAGTEVQSVDMYYNAGHPGVDKPHYHIVLWHVNAEMADVK